jgi:exodeoxyribonuclease V beta subunit
LESDARVVKIVTVHAAKGLEYPIVFCPFLWEGLTERRREDSGVIYHERDAGGNTVLDFGEPSASTRRWAQEEEFAESLRLFYVALTRAKHRCYLVHGAMKAVATAPLAWLLYHDRFDRTREPIAALKEFATQREGAAIWNDLSDLVSRAPQAMTLERLDPRATATLAAGAHAALMWKNARVFTGKIDSIWRVASFSSIAVVADDDARDRDAVRVVYESAPAQNESSIFDFPRGTRAGTCLHRVFETWDFTCEDKDRLREHIRGVLIAEGFHERWVAPVCEMVRNVLATPLDENDAVR